MPSPFPGMDPYLEDAELFSGLHQWLITRIGEELNAVLPSEYVAVVGEWLTVSPAENRIGPDVYLREASERRGGAAVLEAPRRVVDAPLRVEAAEEGETRLYLNIVRARNESQIITALEILSPSNKRPGKDHDAYRRKQREIYRSDTHLLEIDLLRAGAHTVAAPLEMLNAQTWDYLVCLHRGRTGPTFDLWPCAVRDGLPCVSVPLSDGRPDVALDLQSVFEKSYAAGAYWRRIDYNAPPDPPLSPLDTAWADALLRGKGLRGEL